MTLTKLMQLNGRGVFKIDKYIEQMEKIRKTQEKLVRTIDSSSVKMARENAKLFETLNKPRKELEDIKKGLSCIASNSNVIVNNLSNQVEYVNFYNIIKQQKKNKNNLRNIKAVTSEISEIYIKNQEFKESIIKMQSTFKVLYNESTAVYANNISKMCRIFMTGMSDYRNLISILSILQKNINDSNLKKHSNLYRDLEIEVSEILDDQIQKKIEPSIDWTGVRLHDNTVIYENDEGKEVRKEKSEIVKSIFIMLIFPFFINMLSNTVYDKFLGKTDENIISSTYVEQQINYEQIEYNFIMAEKIYNGINNMLSVGEKTIKPRVKPKCSSTVVGILKPGRIVYPLDKYKKWIHIFWENESGEKYSGWIQNWKLEKITK